MSNIDDTDRMLLRLLQKDATLTTKELSEKLNLSSTPVYERQKRLEREGYIDKYVALLNKEKLGKKLTIFCNVKLRQHERGMGETFVVAIQQFPDVVECYNISGEYDFMLKVLVNDMPQYQDFIMNKLTMIENIGSTQSTFVMGEIKWSTELSIY